MGQNLYKYTNNTERAEKVALAESLGQTMLHDDFLPEGNVMTFIDPIPPTAAEIAAQAAYESESGALAQSAQLIDAIANLTDAKLFLKRLVARLIKKGLFP